MFTILVKNCSFHVNECKISSNMLLPKCYYHNYYLRTVNLFYLVYPAVFFKVLQTAHSQKIKKYSGSQNKISALPDF